MNTNFAQNQYELYRDVDDRVVIALHDQSKCTIKEHFHYCLEFIYMLDGELKAVMSGESYTLTKGQMLLISCCEPHRLEYTNAVYYVLMLPHKYFSSYSMVLAKKSFMPKYVTDSSGIILSLFRLFESIDKKQEPFIKIEKNRLDGILKNLCSVLLEIVLGSTVLVDRSEATIQSVRVIEYLYSHYREPITLQFLAKKFLCTQHKLSQDFRQTFGTSPRAFLNRLRLEEVCSCLQADSQMTLKEIASVSGFQSVQTLLRVFKKEYGYTPKEFKRDSALIPEQNEQ